MAHPHVLLVALSAWGHVRPLCVFAAQMVAQDSRVVVTMFSPPNYLEKILPEIRKQLPAAKAVKLMERIRVVSLVAPQPDLDLFQILGPYFQAYPAAYQRLVEGSQIKCEGTGTVFEGVPAPVAVVIDFFALPPFEITRGITGNTVPIFSWITCSAASVLRDLGPIDMGGPGNLTEKLITEAAKLGKSVEEVGDQIINGTDGSVVNLPGLLPMYDYEHYPQIMPTVPIAMLLTGAYKTLTEYDGALITTSDAYEASMLDAMRDWFGKRMGKALFAVGPSYPVIDDSESPAIETHVSAKEHVFKEFLDRKLEEFGKKSVIFVSFGSYFWPSSLDYVEEVIEALIEKRFPFIFCTASPLANVTPELAAKVENSGIGLWTKWSPQQFILDHPATGWFLTHCGFGGVNEALGSGVPLICWPFGGDQPVGAAHLTTNLRVGFELIQVRTGENGLKPLHPSRGVSAPEGTREAVGKEIRAVIQKCRSAEGEEVRKNVERVKDEYSKAWTKDGAATKEMEAFMSQFVLA